MMKFLALLLLILLTQVSARKKQREVMKCGVATVVQPDRVVVFKTLDIGKNHNYTITITNCVNDNIVLVDTHSKAQFPFALPSDRDTHYIGWMELLPDTEYEIRAIEKHHTAVESFSVEVDCPKICDARKVQNFDLPPTITGESAIANCTKPGFWFSNIEAKTISILCEQTGFKAEDVAKITKCVKSPPCSFNNQTIEAEQTGNVTCPQNHHVKGKDNTTTEQPVSCLLGGKFEKDPQCVGSCGRSNAVTLSIGTCLLLFSINVRK
eukprot:896731_1